MLSVGEFILSFICSLPFYLALAGLALAYYGVKYEITEAEIAQFYDELGEPLNIIFRRNGFFFKNKLFPNFDQDLQKPLSPTIANLRRLVWSIVPLIFPLATIIGLTRLSSLSAIILYLFSLMCWCFLFYKCFRFGHRFEYIVKRRT